MAVSRAASGRQLVARLYQPQADGGRGRDRLWGEPAAMFLADGVAGRKHGADQPGRYITGIRSHLPFRVCPVRPAHVLAWFRCGDGGERRAEQVIDEIRLPAVVTDGRIVAGSVQPEVG